MKNRLFFVSTAACISWLGLVLLSNTANAVDESMSDSDYHAAMQARFAAVFDVNIAQNDIHSNASSPDEDLSYQMLGVGVRAFGRIARGFGVQADARAEFTNAEGEDQDQDNHVFGSNLAAHLFWRNRNMGLLGVFGSASFFDGGKDLSDDNTAWVVGGGVEAQIYVHRATFYAQGGFFDTVDTHNSNVDSDIPQDSYFGRVGARYFVKSNTKVQAEFIMAEGEFSSISSPSDYRIYSTSSEVEHSFGDMERFSVYARYEFIYAKDYEDSQRSQDHTFRLGMRARLGGNSGSLFEQDRAGASLDTPDIARWGGILNGAIE